MTGGSCTQTQGVAAMVCRPVGVFGRGQHMGSLVVSHQPTPAPTTHTSRLCSALLQPTCSHTYTLTPTCNQHVSTNTCNPPAYQTPTHTPTPAHPPTCAEPSLRPTPVSRHHPGPLRPLLSSSASRELWLLPAIATKWDPDRPIGRVGREAG